MRSGAAPSPAAGGSRGLSRTLIAWNIYPFRDRSASLLCCLLLALAACGGSDTQAPAAVSYRYDTDTVQTASGTVRADQDSTATMRVFKAIPYALPPLGVLRWKPPQPARTWTGTRNTTDFAPACMQAQGTNYTSLLYTNSGYVSEDCLYLNVWTAAATASERRPVMVLIHGGVNLRGKASNPTYDGAGLASKGVVVVVIAYRLDVFGWLAHPELSAESPNRVSGNYGLLDQIAALQWVKANIAGFGGDPGNVTVYGQSAGAADIHSLMTSPLARGLFHKALMGSGPQFPGIRGDVRTLAQAEVQGQAFAAAASAPDLAALRAMSAPAVQAISANYDSGPTIDGYVLPDQVDRVFRSRQAADIPVIVGYVANEEIAFRPPDAAVGYMGPGAGETFAAFQATNLDTFGPLAEQVRAFYGVVDDASAFAVRYQIPHDFQFGWQVYTMARTVNATTASKAYFYFFNRVPPYYDYQRNYLEATDPRTAGAYHTLEQVYLYNTLDRWPRPYTDVDRRLADIASTYLVNFATSGDPNRPTTTTAAGNVLPYWPPFATTDGQLMLLGDVIAPAAPKNRAAMEFFDGVFVQRLGRPLAFQ
jgi:para-nitrobenzyl esterase